MNSYKKPASVSVVIPCYCCADTIEYAVNSVAEQTLKPYEVILVEDGSSDETLNTLYKLQEKYDNGWVKVITIIRNSGPGTARNVGWDASEQKYIAFLDSDDLWHPQKIEIQYNWMLQNPNIFFTGHECKVVSSEFKCSYIHDYLKPKIVLPYKLIMSNRFATPTVMLKSSIKERFRHGKYFAEDYLLWLQISLSGKKIYRFPHALAFLNKKKYGESGLSNELLQMEKGELEVYVQLNKEGLINKGTLFFIVAYSIVKYLRRVLIKFILSRRFVRTFGG